MSKDISKVITQPTDEMCFEGPKSSSYRISFEPSSKFYQENNEAGDYLRALTTLGTSEVFCDVSRLPKLNALYPDIAYLSWRILVHSNRGASDLHLVFEKVKNSVSLSMSRLSLLEKWVGVLVGRAPRGNKKNLPPKGAAKSEQALNGQFLLPSFCSNKSWIV